MEPHAAGTPLLNARSSEPSQVDGYDVIRKLGQGGMGTVYQAEHRHTRQQVAIKLLTRKPGADEKARELGLREAQALAAVNHPGLVRLYGLAALADGTPYLIMELLDGESLRARRDRIGKLPIPDACALIRQAAAALSEVHAHHVVHRDLKPENLMIVEDREQGPQLKVCDFGIAKLSDTELPTLQSSDSRVIGTVKSLLEGRR